MSESSAVATRFSCHGARHMAILLTASLLAISLLGACDHRSSNGPHLPSEPRAAVDDGATQERSASPSIAMSPARVDWGRIELPSVGACPPREERFIVQNSGPDRRCVEGIATSCGCVQASVDQGCVEPGGASSLLVTVAFAGNGPKTFEASVLWDDGQVSNVRIDAVGYRPRRIMPLIEGIRAEGDLYRVPFLARTVGREHGTLPSGGDSAGTSFLSPQLPQPVVRNAAHTDFSGWRLLSSDAGADDIVLWEAELQVRLGTSSTSFDLEIDDRIVRVER